MCGEDRDAVGIGPVVPAILLAILPFKLYFLTKEKGTRKRGRYMIYRSQMTSSPFKIFGLKKSCVKKLTQPLESASGANLGHTSSLP